ncbi:MAG: phosphatidylethanolamine N-methyltransferase [Candidatus Scalindua rubra]|uniref:Phosphatidylethanolamine N-methyltransferase n=1 Tax=Candidatus Scalindua rubra TaxID=1872076 RepID=A0A1E3X698_9BACT|nr:MAG: phosphatidylethanolamine N-methyltransferase [Candidatus Scalindua rubra]
MPKKIYSLYSHFYDDLFGTLLHPGRRIASRLLDIQPGERILEVGIGTGISLPLYPKDAEVVGIDISKDMIKRAGEKKQRLGYSNVKLCITDASEMAFRNGYFDKAIAAHSITVVPEPLETLKEMKRVCKKNAEFFFLNYAGSDDNLIARFEKAISPIRNMLGLGKAIDLEELLRRASFEIVFKDRVNILKLWQIIKCKIN